MVRKGEQRAVVHPKHLHGSLYEVPTQHEAGAWDSEKSGVFFVLAYPGARWRSFMEGEFTT